LGDGPGRHRAARSAVREQPPEQPRAQCFSVGRWRWRRR
jgi:hypothetical protein